MKVQINRRSVCLNDFLVFSGSIYRIVASTNMCYYSENQVLGVLQFKFYVVKGGATNGDVLVLATIWYILIRMLRV